MKGKVVPLKVRAKPAGPSLIRDWPEIKELLQPYITEMELCLHQEITKAPDLIKDYLLAQAARGERLCPGLFLATVKAGGGEPQEDWPRLSAALEALHLALKMHRSLGRGEEGMPAATAVLCGDFCFSLALSLCADVPIFVKGMAEVISRSAAAAVNMPGPGSGLESWRRFVLQRISSGSASLLALACSLGAWQSRLELWQNEALAFFGHYLGMGWRLRQEISLLERDLREKKEKLEINMPLVYIIERSPRRHQMLALLGKNGGLLPGKLVRGENFCKGDYEDYVNAVAGSCFDKAREYLEQLTGSLDRQILSRFIG